MGKRIGETARQQDEMDRSGDGEEDGDEKKKKKQRTKRRRVNSVGSQTGHVQTHNHRSNSTLLHDLDPSVPSPPCYFFVERRKGERFSDSVQSTTLPFFYSPFRTLLGLSREVETRTIEKKKQPNWTVIRSLRDRTEGSIQLNSTRCNPIRTQSDSVRCRSDSPATAAMADVSPRPGRLSSKLRLVKQDRMGKVSITLKAWPGLDTPSDFSRYFSSPDHSSILHFFSFGSTFIPLQSQREEFFPAVETT